MPDDPAPVDPPTLPMHDSIPAPFVVSSASPGHLFGPYRVLGELGRGGMGVVYRALDTRMNRVVALKTLIAASSDEAVKRFQREVETISALKHPGIVTIHEVGSIADTPYFAMELLEGEPLAQVLRARGPLPPPTAARIARDVARALAYAHEQGVVHRDVKPQNVMIEPVSDDFGTAATIARPTEPPVVLSDGRLVAAYRVVLMDFGLAKVADQETSLTVSGLALGTPAYMSPEQAEGKTKDLDGLTDVYSLGASLYEMCTGWPPFQSQARAELMMQVIQDDPLPPRALSKGVPPDLEVICLKAMNKEKGRRYAGAKAFADDLDRFLRGELIHARPATRLEKAARWVKRRPTASAVAALTLFFALATIAWTATERLLRGREVGRLRAVAEQALSRRDAAAAREAAARAIALAPGDLALDRLRGRAEAAACVAESDRLLAEHQRALEEAVRREASAAQAAAALLDGAPASAREAAWREEDAALQARARAEDLLAQAEQELVKAIGYSRDEPAAHERFCRIHVDAYEAAEARGDAAAMREARRQVAFHDRDGRFLRELDRDARIAVASDPAGAEVFLFRYEERARRLAPCPYDVRRRRALDPPSVEVPTPDVSVNSGPPGPHTAEALVRWRAGNELLNAAKYAEARVELEAALALDADLIEAHIDLARALARLGEIDGAYSHLQEGFGGGYSELAGLLAEPDLAPLASDPRWSVLSATVGGRVPARGLWVKRPVAQSDGSDGLATGDMLSSVRGLAVPQVRTLKAMLAGTPPQESVPVVVARGETNRQIGVSARDLLATEWGEIDLSPRPAVVRRAEALQEVRAACAYPLACGEANRIGTTPAAIALPPGSYLLLLRSEGRVEARCPLLLSRGEAWEGTVRLRTAAEFPPTPPGAWTQDPTRYWCYVPGGRFRSGLDRSADIPLDDEAKEVGDFFAARFEVSIDEWFRFVNDPEVLAKITNTEGHLIWVPRRTTAFNGFSFPGPDGRYLTPPYWWERPVSAVSWRDADVYVGWMRKRLAVSGGWEVGLPHEAEWEKAGRGVDGRVFPWGDRFDWSFCKGYRSRPRDARPEPFGQFAWDEGPYGVRDMAGGESEWTADRFTPLGVHLAVRGGSWSAGDPREFRLASRAGAEDSQVSTAVGLRLVVRRAEGK